MDCSQRPQWHFTFSRGQDTDCRHGSRTKGLSTSQVSCSLKSPNSVLISRHLPRKSQEYNSHLDTEPSSAQTDGAYSSSSEGFCESDRRDSAIRPQDSDSDLGELEGAAAMKPLPSNIVCSAAFSTQQQVVTPNGNADGDNPVLGAGTPVTPSPATDQTNSKNASALSKELQALTVSEQEGAAAAALPPPQVATTTAADTATTVASEASVSQPLPAVTAAPAAASRPVLSASARRNEPSNWHGDEYEVRNTYSPISPQQVKYVTSQIRTPDVGSRWWRNHYVPVSILSAISLVLLTTHSVIHSKRWYFHYFCLLNVMPYWEMIASVNFCW